MISRSHSGQRAHAVRIADLVLVQRRVPETITALVAARRPDVVGLSIMTFQRHTARKVVALLRTLCPSARIVVGGYDPSMATDIYEHPSWDVDAIVRGEGDITFRELLRAWEAGRDPDAVAGLSYRTAGESHGKALITLIEGLPAGVKVPAANL